jgi:hypothetical protein
MLYELFDAALRSAGVSARRRDRFTDRGDGLLALIDPADQALLIHLVIPVSARGRAANAGPQVGVLDAVVQQELGLEVLPARADPSGVSRPGGRGRCEAAQVAPEGIVGHVHHGEVDVSGVRSAVSLVVMSFLLVMVW